MINLFEQELAPYRKKLKEHELYSSIKSIENIHKVAVLFTPVCADIGVTIIKKITINNNF